MADAVLEPRPLPVGGAIGRTGVGWWGLLCFLATEASLFGYLIFSYTYIAVQIDPAAAAQARLSFTFALPMTIVVIASSAVLYLAERAIAANRKGQLLVALVVVLAFSITFVALEAFEWKSLRFTLTSNALGSAYFVTTGTHLAHFVLGIVATVFAIVWVVLGYFDAVHKSPLLILFDYWHFVHAVWGVIFIALYIVPYLG
ncbi:cytochrome c oxidase subunit 3 [Methylovirgula sp. HY1]|uniref:cytochrome c oxidase subunit 3 n=1 Tax=Methylovirgula sp. HY1 TaxID=2822761 RepID=UPI001C5BDAC2|nr:cytochrome c oxidase subunit 3 [Methylovirgula sp. HY1]QXX74101.1 Cytochrome c oxidase subunit 3 [Methylovirgula sp. HY1]